MKKLHPILQQRHRQNRAVLVEPDPQHPYGARINVSGPFNWYQLLCLKDERANGEILVRLPRRVYVGYYGELQRWPFWPQGQAS